MKLLIVLCVQECIANVGSMMKKAGVEIFSKIDATGFKNTRLANLSDEWFASGEEAFRSAVVFSFTSQEIAAAVAELAAEYNAGEAAEFPLRVFTLSVDGLLS